MKTNLQNLGEKYRDSDVTCSAVAHFPRLAIFLSTRFYEALNLQLSLESVQCTLYDVQYIVHIVIYFTLCNVPLTNLHGKHLSQSLVH